MVKSRIVPTYAGSDMWAGSPHGHAAGVGILGPEEEGGNQLRQAPIAYCAEAVQFLHFPLI